MFVKHDAFGAFGEGEVAKQSIRILQKPYHALQASNPEAEMSMLTDVSFLPGENDPPEQIPLENLVTEAEKVGVDC